MSKKEIWTIGESGAKVKVKIADNFILRTKGLIGKSTLPDGEGLFLYNTISIHMCFMRFAIDAIYFDKQYKIVKIVRNLKPWTGISGCLKAKSCLELRAGEADRLGLAVGDVVISKQKI